MEKIASFTVDHDVLGLGMYISRIDGDVVTYDIRMKLPNQGDYLDVPGMHTIEHLFATYARNTAWKDNIIYVCLLYTSENVVLEDLGVQLGNAVDAVGTHNAEVRHPHLMVRNNGELFHLAAVTEGVVYIVHKAVVDLHHNLVNAGEQHFEYGLVPAFQRLAHNGVVGIGKGPGGNIPRLFPACLLYTSRCV